MRNNGLLSLAMIATGMLAGCNSARPVGETSVGNCTGCHGGVDNDTGAPPNDLSGSSTSAAVGAHTAHLAWGVLCETCHKVPAQTGDAGHIDPAPAEITFGAAAKQGGPIPTYDFATHTCNGTYCHGGTLNAGGENHNPVWNVAFIGDPCSQCHGAPPPAPEHPSSSDCSLCHLTSVNDDDKTIKAGGTHLNGRVDANAAGNVHPAGWVVPFGGQQPHGLAANFHDAAWPQGLAQCKTCHGDTLDGGSVSSISCNACHATPTASGGAGNANWQGGDCTFCHGDPARASNPAAPPVGTQGESATTTRAVGAHQKHLGVDPIGVTILPAGLACTECHAVPTTLDHVNGQVAMTWGPTATKDGAVLPDWTGATCTNYCHGSTLPPSTPARPAVTWAPPTTETCGMCHQSSPTTGQHPAVQGSHSSVACSTCHLTDYTTTKSANHVNKLIEVSTASPVVWDPATRTCTAACHGGASHSW